LTYKLNFYPYFDQIVGHFVKCLVSCVISAKVFAITILNLICTGIVLEQLDMLHK
jgi:hypothetical protein